MIYLIDFKTCYKIGRTNNLTQRLKTFKNSREDLELISLIAFPDKIVLQEVYDQNGETYLHNKLKNFNIKNELFSRDPQVLSEFLNYKYNIVKDMIDWVELYYNNIQDNKQKSDNTIYQYNIDGVLLNTYKSGTEASKQTGINISCISNNIAGRTKRAGNFHWKYN